MWDRIDEVERSLNQLMERAKKLMKAVDEMHRLRIDMAQALRLLETIRQSLAYQIEHMERLLHEHEQTLLARGGDCPITLASDECGKMALQQCSRQGDQQALG